MEKKNTGLIVLVVVLSLLVVGLGGYIVYDKMLDKNINDSDNKGKNDNIIDKNDKNEVAKINETIVVDINNDKTYNKDINNHNVYVDERTLKIDNKVFCELNDINYLYQVSFYDDVIITYQSVGTSGSFVIYDYNGNAVKKIEKLESYLSEGLPRYQDILEEKNIEMPEAPDGIEYRNPGIMESQIFTVLSKRFKSGRLSFGKIGATCLAKICASKVENKGVIELEKLEQPIEIDDSIEQYMLEIEKNLEGITNVFRANEKIASNNICKQVTLNPNNPILQAIKMVSISDLKYIYKFN